MQKKTSTVVETEHSTSKGLKHMTNILRGTRFSSSTRRTTLRAEDDQGQEHKTNARHPHKLVTWAAEELPTSTRALGERARSASEAATVSQDSRHMLRPWPRTLNREAIQLPSFRIPPRPHPDCADQTVAEIICNDLTTVGPRRMIFVHACVVQGRNSLLVPIPLQCGRLSVGLDDWDCRCEVPGWGVTGRCRCRFDEDASLSGVCIGLEPPSIETHRYQRPAMSATIEFCFGIHCWKPPRIINVLYSTLNACRAWTLRIERVTDFTSAR